MMQHESQSRLEQHGIARIPDGWTRSRVKYLGTYINGYAFKPEHWSDTGRPILRIQDLSGLTTEPNRFNGESQSRYLVRPGDVLISWSASLDVCKWHGEGSSLRRGDAVFHRHQQPLQRLAVDHHAAYVAFTRSTQKPFSLLWKVTRSIRLEDFLGARLVRTFGIHLIGDSLSHGISAIVGPESSQETAQPERWSSLLLAKLCLVELGPRRGSPRGS